MCSDRIKRFMVWRLKILLLVRERLREHSGILNQQGYATVESRHLRMQYGTRNPKTCRPIWQDRPWFVNSLLLCEFECPPIAGGLYEIVHIWVLKRHWGMCGRRLMCRQTTSSTMLRISGMTMMTHHWKPHITIGMVTGRQRWVNNWRPRMLNLLLIRYVWMQEYWNHLACLQTIKQLNSPSIFASPSLWM